MTGGRCVAVVPAKDEAQRVAGTVAALAALPQVAQVVVVDDGSRDDTADRARAAGAQVVVHRRNRGKAAAMTTGVRHAREQGRGALPVLFADADLEASASALDVLAVPVLAGEADLTIAVLPPQRTPGGGRGLVVGLARDGIARLTAFTAAQPLSGMRCLSPAALDAVQPFARGWGVETAMTIDALRAGLRVREVPCELHHRVTGSDWRGQWHRATQYRDVALALAVRRLRAARRRTPATGRPFPPDAPGAPRTPDAPEVP